MQTLFTIAKSRATWADHQSGVIAIIVQPVPRGAKLSNQISHRPSANLINEKLALAGVAAARPSAIKPIDVKRFMSENREPIWMFALFWFYCKTGKSFRPSILSAKSLTIRPSLHRQGQWVLRTVAIGIGPISPHPPSSARTGW
jgi:hypothetical protein